MLDSNDDEIYSEESSYFREIAASLSFIAAGLMFYLLVSEPNARRQVRPRMLIVLTVLDGLAALGLLIGTIKSVLDHHFVFSEALGLLGAFFQFASWTWTCLIAFHMYQVIVFKLEPNSEVEKRQEYGYLIFLFVSMCCIFLPVQMYFYFGADHHGVYAIPVYRDLQIVYLALQYTVVVCCTLRVFFIWNLTDEEKRYRTQITLFALMFIGLTAQLMIVQVEQRTPGFDISNYNFFFGESHVEVGVSSYCVEC